MTPRSGSFLLAVTEGSQCAGKELLPKDHRASGAGGRGRFKAQERLSVERVLKATVVLEVFCRKLVKGGANSIEMRG